MSDPVLRAIALSSSQVNEKVTKVGVVKKGGNDEEDEDHDGQG
jgi:hypothetical protein